MKHQFGLKMGMSPEKIIPLFVCIIPPLMFCLGGIGILVFSITDYYDMMEIGLYEQEFMESQLTSGVVIGSILIGIALILCVVLLVIRRLYKTGYWCIYGFTYHEDTRMLQVHRGHRIRQYYVGSIIDVRIMNRGLRTDGQYDQRYSYRKTSYGYLKVCFFENGKKKWDYPYGMLADVESTRNVIASLVQQEREYTASFTTLDE